MLVKIHDSYRTTVAICDSDVLDKKFEEGIYQLDMTGNFFRGEEKSDEETKEIIDDFLREDATFNIVGEKACKLALSCGLIEKSAIIRIQSVPVALVLI